MIVKTFEQETPTRIYRFKNYKKFLSESPEITLGCYSLCNLGSCTYMHVLTYIQYQDMKIDVYDKTCVHIMLLLGQFYKYNSKEESTKSRIQSVLMIKVNNNKIKSSKTLYPPKTNVLTQDSNT